MVPGKNFLSVPSNLEAQRERPTDLTLGEFFKSLKGFP